ncbi:Rrf2 family transcriptional regulator [Hyphobacterium sp. SN044]|uniref:Rrf2 family transcriptional regulator n=1 Tax=Hyphobacterium sp. SN044 TaxID=2912575 RepID=UPI001F2C63D8|nr:Rrf2 family transcriptional regulator [Hyphobacterium sp. SN044]MCF8879192.1 Rrf2 family transcriptional regulator [Hyphobacterium sp. SN044]
MKLSTKGRYAVMAMADLASRDAEGPVTLADIASRQAISLSYLEQLFAKLRRGNVVASARGPGGGYSLARPANEIRLSDVIKAVEEDIDPRRCAGNPKGCMKTGMRCITHDVWDELGRHIFLFFNSITLEDVVEHRVMGAASMAFSDPRMPKPSKASVAGMAAE